MKKIQGIYIVNYLSATSCLNVQLLRKCLIVVFLVLSMSHSAFAAHQIFYVNSIADRVDINPGDGICQSLILIKKSCTLRAAIMESAASGHAIIQLQAKTYVLTIPGKGENLGATGDLDITGELIIRGKGINKTIIEAKGIDRVFHIFNPESGPKFKVTISNLTITGGTPFPDQDGGGIWNSQILKLIKVKVVKNQTDIGGQGGGAGIWSDFDAKLTLRRVNISNNTAFSGGGGGVRNHFGFLHISGKSVIYNNKSTLGGGILIDGGDSKTIIKNTKIVNNESTVDFFGGSGGGGISHFGGKLSLSYTILRGNKSFSEGGAISILGSDVTSLYANHVIINKNQSRLNGGGIYISDSFAPKIDVQILNSTISNNLAKAGGGIYQDTFKGALSPLVIKNSTISGNIVEETGAGLYTFGDVNLVDTTIAENRSSSSGNVYNGMGVYFATTTSANVSINRSLISGSNATLTGTSPDCVIDPGVVFTSLDYNLMERIGPACNFIAKPNDQLGTFFSPIDPLLGLLQNNGGFGLTHALQPGSPTIDKAGPGPCGILNKDQRGTARPTDGDGNGASECDIGAFETAGI
ncbi:MAG: choice-of-anchor Q domain-containing protein [Methylococcales bacterium]